MPFRIPRLVCFPLRLNIVSFGSRLLRSSRTFATVQFQCFSADIFILCEESTTLTSSGSDPAFGADEEIRTLTLTHWDLKPACLPITPHPLSLFCCAIHHSWEETYPHTHRCYGQLPIVRGTKDTAPNARHNRPAMHNWSTSCHFVQAIRIHAQAFLSEEARLLAPLDN